MKPVFALTVSILINILSKSVLVVSDVSEPLVYTRLRFDDHYLQLFRRYQLEQPHKEKQLTLVVNKGEEQNKVEYKYYENINVEKSSITRDGLILEALDRTYKSRLFPSLIYNYDNEEDRNRSSDPKLVSHERCNQELDYLKIKMGELDEASGLHNDPPISPELAAFFDSYAREEPGLLFGNYHWVGNWRQCSQRHIFDLNRDNPSETVSFKGRYCVASLRSRRWKSKIKNMTEELLENYFKYPQQRHDYERFFRIQVGLCLPESCDSAIVYSRNDDIRQLVVNKLNQPVRSYELVDLYCLPDETSKLREIETSGWLLIILTVCWSVCIVVATICDLNITKKTMNAHKNTTEKLISALSLRRNFYRLVEMDSMRPKETKSEHPKDKRDDDSGKPVEVKPISNRLSQNDLLFLNAFKVISMPFIIFGHNGMINQHLNRFPLNFDSFDSKLAFHFHASTVFLVDWYFVITGFLTTYIMFVSRKVERNSIGQWMYTMFHRYWRLAPLYILLFWFTKSLFLYTSYGPVWDYGTSNMTLRSICRRESWIWPLTLTSNLHPLHEECIMPSWYISNDMQFYLITPFLLIALSRSPLIGWLSILGVILASIAGRFHKYLTSPRVRHLELMRPRFDLYMYNNWDVHPTYLYPQYRISAYLVGVLAGHYTYMVLSGQWNSVLYQSRARADPNCSVGRFKGRLVRSALWFTGVYIVGSLMLATMIISELFPKSLEPQVKYYTSLVYGLDHTFCAFGMCLIFVTFMFGQYPKLKGLLSHPLWTLVSRVNYVVFLIQVEVIYWLQQSAERVMDYSLSESIKLWLLLICICYSMAIILTLWLEMPLAHLEREFIGSVMMPRRPVDRTENGRMKLVQVEQANDNSNLLVDSAKIYQSDSQNIHDEEGQTSHEGQPADTPPSGK